MGGGGGGGGRSKPGKCIAPDRYMTRSRPSVEPYQVYTVYPSGYRYTKKHRGHCGVSLTRHVNLLNYWVAFLKGYFLTCQVDDGSAPFSRVTPSYKKDDPPVARTH